MLQIMYRVNAGGPLINTTSKVSEKFTAGSEKDS